MRLAWDAEVNHQPAWLTGSSEHNPRVQTQNHQPHGDSLRLPHPETPPAKPPPAQVTARYRVAAESARKLRSRMQKQTISRLADRLNRPTPTITNNKTISRMAIACGYHIPKLLQPNHLQCKKPHAFALRLRARENCDRGCRSKPSAAWR